MAQPQVYLHLHVNYWSQKYLQQDDECCNYWGRSLADRRESWELLLLVSMATNHLQSFAATLWSYCIIAAHSATAMELHRDERPQLDSLNNQKNVLNSKNV